MGFFLVRGSMMTQSKRYCESGALGRWWRTGVCNYYDETNDTITERTGWCLVTLGENALCIGVLTMVVKFS